MELISHSFSSVVRDKVKVIIEKGSHNADDFYFIFVLELVATVLEVVRTSGSSSGSKH